MSKKKIIAIVLFIFLGLFMFTYANPGDVKLEPNDPTNSDGEITDPSEGNNDPINNGGNGNNETISNVVDKAPVVKVTPNRIVILLGSAYDVMDGVTVEDDHDLLTATADITDTTVLTVGSHTITYTVTDSKGNTSKAVRTIVVLDPEADEDNDGFTNEEELENPEEPKDPTKPVGPENPLVPTDPKDPEDENDHPETYAPTIELKGNNPYIMLKGGEYVEAGVTITLDPHDNLTTEEDVIRIGLVKTDEVGEYTLTYTIIDRYGKRASVTRTVKVLDPEADEDNDGFTNEEELENPEEPKDPTKPVGPENPLVPTDPTDPEDENDHPETYAPTIELKGNNPYIMLKDGEYVEAGVTITLDPHDDITTVDDVVVTGEIDTTKIGEYTLTYTIVDRYGKSANVTRTVKVLDPEADEDNDGFTNEEELENPEEPKDPTKPVGPENPLVPTDPTDPENENDHPETYAPSITLLGDNPTTIEVFASYMEKGVEITLDPHDDITTIDDVVVTGEVDTTKIGEYTLTYTIVDRYGKSANVTRTVKVVDTTKPVIELIGNDTIELPRGTTYNELGAIVTDNYDKDIEAVIDATNVDTTKLGTYKVTYNAKDLAGNEAIEVIRTVVVVRSDEDKTLNRIEATMTKTEYQRGEEISTLVVIAYDNDGTSYDVTSLVSHDFDSTTIGSKTLTVTYEGKEDTVDYTVVRSDEDKALNRIEATMTKTEYQRGEEISTLVVIAYDNDGTSYDVTSLVSHDFDSATIGSKTLTVTYEGKEDTVDYTVISIAVDVSSSKPIANAEGKKAEPGETVDYEISLSATSSNVVLPTYTIEVAEGMTLVCPTNVNVVCTGNTLTWTPTSIDEKLSYSAKVDDNAKAGSILTTTIKDGEETIKEFDTRIEVTVNVISSSSQPTTMEVVLTLDVSGSMWGKTSCDANGKNCKSTKIKDLISVSKQFINNLNTKNTNGSTINLTIITFGRLRGDSTCNAGFHGLGADRTGCYETIYSGALTSSTLSSIEAKIDAIDDNGENTGGTPLYGALNSALNIINQSTLANKYLVVLGDGTPTDSDSYGVIEALKTTSANVYSIGFGISNDTAAQTVLNNVVNNKEGHYFSADNADSLQNSFNMIEQSISSVPTQTIEGSVNSDANNATKITISYKDSSNTKQTFIIEDVTNEEELAKYHITIDDGKYVWDVSKYSDCKEFEMIIEY